MTAVAVIGDIHGNAVALDAVLAEIAARGVDRVVCLGDVVACGPEPEEVVARLRSLDCPCVLGNTDDWLLGRVLPRPNQDDFDALMALIEWGTRTISDETRAYLASLPLRYELELDDLALICFHGSPRSYDERILPETPEETLAEMLASLPAAVYACGHTHLPLVRGSGDALVVNPGSVGVALDRAAGPMCSPPPFAEYAVVNATGNGVDADLRRVAVDARAVRAAARASGMPHSDEWASILGRRVARSNERARAALAGRPIN